MSTLLQAVLKSSGALSVTVNTDAPDFFSGGIPLESDGTLAVDTASAVANHQQGLPFTAAGRLAVTTDAPTDTGMGAAPYAGGKLCMEAGTIVNTTGSVPFVADGSVASTSLA
jgi:hypothetical protein